MAKPFPGYLTTTTNRNKRVKRYAAAGDNDQSYRLGTSNAPSVATADNKRLHRFS
jgi:hypothetical protein